MKRIESARKRLEAELKRAQRRLDEEESAIEQHEDNAEYHRQDIKRLQCQLGKIENPDFYLRVEVLHNECKLAWPSIEVAERYLDIDYEYEDVGQIKDDIELLRSLLICYNK